MLTSAAKSFHNTKLTLIIRILFLLALPLAVFSSGSAASLEGKVTDVVDGEDLAVLSQGHLVKIKLVGVAAPRLKQAYGSVARQHLADLILNKYVVVRYWSLREGYIVGQVLLENVDIGAQMIRDGVGWYNKTDAASLSDPERQVYQASQDAARGERRGLWQDESPVAPWDFRNAQLAPVSTFAVPPPVPPDDAVRDRLPRQTAAARRSTGLSSGDLMSRGLQPGSMAGKPDIRPLSSSGAPGRWLRYQPADKHFSVLVPSDGIETTYPVLDGQGKAVDFHYVSGTGDRAFYFVMWAKVPREGSTEDSAVADTIKGLLSGINRVTEKAGLFVTATAGRDLKITGYVGKEFILDDPASGIIRIFSKQIGDERELFVLCQLTPRGSDDSGTEFFNSFKIH